MPATKLGYAVLAFALLAGCSAAPNDVDSSSAAVTEGAGYELVATAAVPAPTQIAKVVPWMTRAVVAVESGASSTPLAWDGTKLVPINRAEASRPAANAYDPRNKKTYVLDAYVVGAYTSSPPYVLFGASFDTHEDEQAAMLFVNAAGNVFRVIDGGVSRLDLKEDGNHQWQAHWRVVGSAPGWCHGPAVYDELRDTLVVFGGAGTEVCEVSMASDGARWLDLKPQVVGMPAGGGDRNSCDAGFWDPDTHRAVLLCWNAHGSSGREWDGTTFLWIGLKGFDAASSATRVAYDRDRHVLLSVLGDNTILISKRAQVVAPPSNHPPSVPETRFSIYATEDANLDLKPEDADLDPVRVTLVDGPPGLTLSGSTIHWTPGAAEAGAHLAHVTLFDGLASVNVELTFTVNVVSYPGLPAHVATSATGTAPGTTMDRGYTTGTQAQFNCSFRGENPGIVRASCSASFGLCSESIASSPCSSQIGRSVSISTVVSANGSFSGTASCTAASCTTEWNFLMDGSVGTPTCAGYHYSEFSPSQTSTGHGCF